MGKTYEIPIPEDGRDRWSGVLLDEHGTRASQASLLFPGRIKRDKGVWWMPWQQEAMKDVVHCDKPWGAVNRL